MANMLRPVLLAVAACGLSSGWSGTARAVDKEACGAAMVCASDPGTVVDALMAAGYKAKLTKDAQGDPKIESAASGYNFSIYFYDCEESKNCAALQFQVSFADDGKNTLDLANRWNANKRFMQMSVTEDKGLRVCYDITTVGGLNQKNFADVVDWWAVMLNELNGFFKEAG
jgi:hypothetical protein